METLYYLNIKQIKTLTMNKKVPMLSIIDSHKMIFRFIIRLKVMSTFGPRGVEFNVSTEDRKKEAIKAKK